MISDSASPLSGENMALPDASVSHSYASYPWRIIAQTSYPLKWSYLKYVPRTTEVLDSVSRQPTLQVDPLQCWTLVHWRMMHVGNLDTLGVKVAYQILFGAQTKNGCVVDINRYATFQL
mmetsp:Transcript_15566/g.33637  ORF Transcript_15566/g.33637 Transcript_15566/m.33637 type:complete len:119 (+) Transcript_15566:2642-2998(+)